MRHTSGLRRRWWYSVLIVFASLFADGWRAQGIDPRVFLFAKIPPPYWTWFDVNTNIVGRVPLGFFLALALMRSGKPRLAVPLGLSGRNAAVAVHGVFADLPAAPRTV